jgi:hypothetical protein
MADPITILGAIASAAQLIGGIANTIKTLTTLQDRLAGVDTTIHILIGKLKTVKHALSRIQVWARNHSSAIVEDDQDFASQFLLAKENVELAVEALENDVFSLIKDLDNPNVTFITRAKCLWNEERMKGHEEVLRDTVLFLQVLVNAVQW